MTTISICIGSACHLKGSYQVLEAFKALIDQYQLLGQVVMEGNFCQGCCTEGVVIKIDDEIIQNVTQEKVYEIFVNKVWEKNHDQTNHHA